MASTPPTIFRPPPLHFHTLNNSHFTSATFLRNPLPPPTAAASRLLCSVSTTSDSSVSTVEIARAYEKGGAACLSVLTDEKGSFNNLEAIRSAGVKCPLLCKEFIVDAWQIYYARLKGTDTMLLIAAVPPDLDLRYMTKICKLLGLAALVEVHVEHEMDRVLGIEGIELVGINNRNLETFEVDIANTKKLLEGEQGRIIHEKGILVVEESGLFTPADIAYVQDAGVKAVLVGESIVKQNDPAKGISGILGKDISL